MNNFNVINLVKEPLQSMLRKAKHRVGGECRDVIVSLNKRCFKIR